MTEGLRRIDEITAEHVRVWGDALAAKGRADSTRRHHETALKAFTAWLERTGRLPVDPLRHFRKTGICKGTEVRKRDAYTDSELSRILTATRSGPMRYKFTALQRVMLYRFACETGFRAEECAAVRKKDFSDDLCWVHLATHFTKDKKGANQPIPQRIRADLSQFIVNLGPDDWLWPGGWQQNDRGKWVAAGWIKDSKAGYILTQDATAAGLVIGLRGMSQNGGRALDFHSFRHVFGVSLRGLDKETQMRLLRTTSEKVWARYCHPDDVVDFAERLAALESRKETLPSLAVGS